MGAEVSYNFDTYFKQWSYYTGVEVRKGFLREYVSLWPSWLGEDEYHKFDEVTVKEWARFNLFIRFLGRHYDLLKVRRSSSSLEPASDLSVYLSGFRDSMNKSASEFSIFVIPKLECVIIEEWDYTYIIWHKNNNAVEALAPFIKSAGLKHFRENKLRSKRLLYAF